MASAAVVAAVEALVAANWTNTVVIGVNLTGEPPADGSPWLTIQYPVATEQHIGMAGVGSRSFRESGTIRLVLSIKRSQGAGQGLLWLDQLRALFRAAQFGGVTCFAPSPPIENNTNADGNFWVLSFSVPYFYDLFA